VQLAAQGLLVRRGRKATKADVMEMIGRMGALQIDTINVVARSPYLVLWSRLGAYEPRWLDELLAERKIFEYWAHEASFLPMEDYPLFRYRMLDPESMGWKYRFDASHRELVPKVLEAIRERGPVRSSDFQRPDRGKGGWWQWKGEKRVLENLFTAGDVMIARRENFQRVYDLRERVRPDGIDDVVPTRHEAERVLATKAVRALGVTQANWVADYYRMSKKTTPALVEQLAESGALLRGRVAGWKEDAFAHPDHAELLAQAENRALKASHTTLLSPFDPIVWDRARASAVFAFDYRLECYTPGPKRQFGYFVLSILRRGNLVGRLDAKAHRRDGTFEVKVLYLEEDVKPSAALAADIARALQECADWHGTPDVVVRRTVPARFLRDLKSQLSTKA
jgi:uncharacterized protein YcaQ